MTTCPCGTETTTGWVCRVCVGRLRRDMERLAELWPDTINVLTRQTATGTGGKTGGKGAAKSTPLPFDDNASEVRWLVENTITTWVRDLAGDRAPEGVHDVPSACLWLAHNAQKVASTQEGPDALDELRDALRQIVWLVDRPESPIYLGVHDCGSDVWAKSHRLYQMCDCGTVLDLDAIRSDKMKAARTTWATAKDIGAAAQKIAGVNVTKVMISRWYKAGDLEQHHRLSRDGRTLEFRVGAVLDLARRHAERNAVASDTAV